MSQSDDVRRSILVTMNEISEAEHRFKDEHGIDISDPGEWLQLRDIVARIERRLAQQVKAKEPAE
jgi:hypothetical protein